MKQRHTLYPHNNTSELDLALFRHPTAEYRGAPFWSWNNRLDKEQLLRQIEVFKIMGMGGFHIHSRTGMATEYLGEEFMEMVKACLHKGQEEGMLTWLYDEDRWPSGFAGGLVTRELKFRARHLLFTCIPYNGHDREVQISGVKNRYRRADNGVLLARYAVWLQNGYLAKYRRLADDEEAPVDSTCWLAYLETALPSPWFNNQTYVDTLNKEAIQRFIEVTHERYAEVVGAAFGKDIPAIFTDEPQFTRKQHFKNAEGETDLIIPWTGDFPETYQAIYEQDVLDILPEIFWELPERQASLARYRYHDHIGERFASAFADTVGAWCDAHGLALTGHMMEEPTLHSQTLVLSEAMRSYRGFALPGIDMLCDRHEYTTAKQAQSASHQYGRSGVLSELYGVTNWDFDFVGHKAQGDWQAALGVTVRVHHLSWVSMAGEAKRDYPASISYQSPWYREYALIEDHFARLNTVLTRGQAHVRVGVIHPIESFWLCFGPSEQTHLEQEERESNFAAITNWLLFGLVDFDFIAESLLPTLCPESAKAPLQVGAAHYDCIIVPSMRTIRSTTLTRLEDFHTHGGQVIFAGEIPSLIDAVSSERVKDFAHTCKHIELTNRQIMEAVEPYRDVDIRLSKGGRADSIVHQIRDEGEKRYIFFCNTDKAHELVGTKISLQGAWQVTILDTLHGETFPLPTNVQQGSTLIEWDFPAHGSLLLTLTPAHRDSDLSLANSSIPDQSTENIWEDYAECSDPVSVTLSEPNVLVLDQAEYQLDDEGWQAEEEVLRIENIVRTRLGYPLKMDVFAQPWTETEHAGTEHTVKLRFTLQSEILVEEPQLALEAAIQTAITLNGQQVPSEITGWFVDESIQTVRLPTLTAGKHALELTIPFGRLTNLEWCYVLGDFGVQVSGRHTRITEPVRTLTFGDWTQQGLPFYAGNVTYHCSIDGTGIALALHTPKFKSPLLSVDIDGRLSGKIAFAPFRIELGRVEQGPHTVDITAYGNRINAFGSLHNANEKWFWFGPNAWRTTGDNWSYEYQLRPMGLLVAPRLQRR